jgi:hypothetical protein
MKNTLIILILFLFACNTKNDKNNLNQKNDLTDSLTIKIIDKSITRLDEKIESAKRFNNKNSDKIFEDTLILKTSKGIFEITPTGLLKLNNGSMVQLTTKLVVDEAFLFQDNKFLYVFYTETDYDGATSWIEKINIKNLKTEYNIQIQGFNLGKPIVQNNKAYVTTIGFVGMIDLNTGNYDWKHYNLYDYEKSSFNSFDTILIKKNNVEFLSENYHSKHLDKVIVDKTTGKINHIIK